MKTLLVMMGFPRSGKSTWAKAHGAPVVSTDAIRLAMTGQAFFPPAEPMVWAIARTMVEALFEVHDTVILDACNSSRERRQMWKTPRWSTFYVEIKTPWQKCYERAMLDGKPELREVIERMARNWQPLQPDEEPWYPASPQSLSEK